MISNKKFCLIIIILIAVIVILVVSLKNDTTSSENEVTSQVSEIQYDNETGEYYILNEATNEVIASSTDEASLQIYIDNPDYNPVPVNDNGSTDEELEEEMIEEY